ncbi:MAG TPA: methyltransferase domain-containing protein [Acidimicrobiales bacterium]
MSSGGTDDARDTWEAVAPTWERHRDRLFSSSRMVSEWLVDELGPRPGQTVLELTSGPGETGFLVAERVGPEGRLISSDLVPAMVDVARRGAAERGLRNVEFRVVDAQDIDLPDASVDGVLSRFGLMLVPDPAQAFREVRRVLRPGGRLAYAVWGTPERNAWVGLMLAAMIKNGHPPPGDAFAPGGVLSLATAERNRDLLSHAGFTDVRITEVASTMHVRDLDDYWSLQSAVVAPVARAVESLPADQVEAVKATVDESLAAYRDGDGYELPSLATVVRAS